MLDGIVVPGGDRRSSVGDINVALSDLVLLEGLSDAGHYKIYICTHDSTIEMGVDGQYTVVGTVFASQGFRISKSTFNPLGVIIVVVIVVLVAVVAIFFIRFRMGMRTR